jgi:hypothetical protein
VLRAGLPRSHGSIPDRKICFGIGPFKLRPLRTVEMSGSDHAVMQSHIPGEQMYHLFRYESLKSRKSVLSVKKRSTHFWGPPSLLLNVQWEPSSLL